MPQVSVIGTGSDEDPRAEEVGRLLAERGCVVVCGGLGGVMAAAARGAKGAGGTTIGILPGESRRDANPWIDHAVVTGMGHARNLAVVASGDAVIAVAGEWGTLAEIGLARKLGRPGRRPRAGMGGGRGGSRTGRDALRGRRDRAAPGRTLSRSHRTSASRCSRNRRSTGLAASSSARA